MKYNTILGIIIFILSFQVFSQDKLKNFDLPVYGKEETLTLESLKADKIVINFFASWCVACMKEVPELNHLKEMVASDQNVIFLAINANEKDYKIAKFLKKTKFSYRILKDKDLEYSLSVGVEELPRTLVLDADKKIIYSSDIPPNKI